MDPTSPDKVTQKIKVSRGSMVFAPVSDIYNSQQEPAPEAAIIFNHQKKLNSYEMTK